MDAPPVAMRMPTPKAPKPDATKSADEADPFAGTADREEDFSPFDPAEKGDTSALKMPKTQRPAAPGPAQSDIQRKRFWLIGGVVGVLVIAVAGLAYKLRDKPEDLARRAQQNAAQVEQQTPAGNGKIVERVGAGARDTAARPSTPQPVQQIQQQAPVADSNPAIPVANRAALLLESPDEPTKVKTFIGTVIWRLDNVPGGPGQPLTTAVRADVDVPDAKLTVSMIFEKNTEATLPASHTIKLRFKAGPDSVVGGVKQVNVPQMRREEAPAGDPIMGIPVPIMENSFLIGLARGTAEATNLDLIANRLWFDVPMLLSSGKVAKITFEKGVAGERAINEAIATWSK